ncbi:ankyrin [Lojkania enalia]|uniref:Ankyrin n=1 Tax=Lojkania enalia TaxID=147567 RepID=A0A9P4K1R4_9PLEO|nr:ankyrin [Didymosphaeria enalia]
MFQSISCLYGREPIAFEARVTFRDEVPKEVFTKAVKNNKGEVILGAACIGIDRIVDILISNFSVGEDNSEQALNLALYRAAFGGHIGLASNMIDRGENVNSNMGRIWSKSSAIFKALYHSHIEMAKFLINEGANPNLAIDGYFTIWVAASESYKDIRNQNKSVRSLQVAAQKGLDAIFFLLVQYGVDVSEENLVKWKLLHPALVASAARVGSYNVLDYLLTTGIKPYLLVAKERSAAGAPEKLVSFVRNTHRRAQDRKEAVENGNIEILRILVEAGGDMNKPSQGKEDQTALEVAAYRDRLDMVQCLLEIRMEVRSKGNKQY